MTLTLVLVVATWMLGSVHHVIMVIISSIFFQWLKVNGTDTIGL
jgi:hypothetical protein